MELEKIKDSMYNLIGEDTSKAFQFLDKYISKQSPKFALYLLKKKQWKMLQKDVNLGTLNRYSPEGLRLSNEINLALIELTQQLEKNDFKGWKVAPSPSNIVPLTSAIASSIQELINQNENIIGYHSGFKELDDLTLGFKNGELTLFSAITDMGMTSFLINVLYNMGRSDFSILHCSPQEKAKK